MHPTTTKMPARQAAPAKAAAVLRVLVAAAAAVAGGSCGSAGAGAGDGAGAWPPCAGPATSNASASNITDVHLVMMNHLDVGFGEQNGTQPGYINNGTVRP